MKIKFNLFEKKGKTRELVAIKCVLKSSLSKVLIDNLITEISILKKVKHQFIVELKDFQWNDYYIYLIFEFCCGGELAQLIRHKKRFSEPIVKHFLQQIATALKVLRLHSIAHMDLKPQNILIATHLSDNNWRNVILKIADFGYAQYLRNEDEATSLRGSPLYMAPEILLTNQYDASVDLWSVGIILYECLFGSPPYSSDSFAELAEKIKNPNPIKIPQTIDLSDNCRNLLTRLLQRDPQKRISFEDFFAHPFIDLEHMPSHESYVKGVELINEAVERDLKCDYNESFKLYTKGLQYLVPIYNWGEGTTVWDQNKQELLKTKIIGYMDRAEAIKKKCNFIVVDKEDLSSIQSAYESIDEANNLVKTGDLKEAFDKYNKGIEIAVKLMSKLKGNEKTSLYAELDQWISKAESIKQQLNTSDNRKNKKNNSKKEKFNKTSNENKELHNNNQNEKSISFSNFISNTLNSKDLRFSPTCYVQ